MNTQSKPEIPEIFEYEPTSNRASLIKAMFSGTMGVFLGCIFSLGKTFVPKSQELLWSYAQGGDLMKIGIGYITPAVVALVLIYMHRVRDSFLAFYIGIASVALFQWFGLLNLSY